MKIIIIKYLPTAIKALNKAAKALFALAVFIPIAVSGQILVKKQTVQMGSVFEIAVVEKDSTIANHRIEQVVSEIARIENLISEWIPTSQISLVNISAGIRPVKVDEEVFKLTQRAIRYSQLSEGAFDISIAAMDHVWKFDGSMDRLPTTTELRQSVRNVGYENIQLDSVNFTIFLPKPGMKIGFGSIGKGYAADAGRAFLQSLGVPAGFINASGDISTWGSQPQGQPWKIGITNPFKKSRILKVLKLHNSAVATSGSYEKYVEIDGKRYSHIINPKTGLPATGLTSITVMGPSCEIANSLSTTIMVIGWKKGKKIISTHAGYSAIALTDKGRIKRY